MASGRWYRVGSLYPNTIQYLVPKYSTVEFRNARFGGSLQKIIITHNHELPQIRVAIKASPFTYDSLSKLIKIVFEEVEAFDEILIFSINFNPASSVNQFKNFFSLVAKAFSEPIPLEIIRELEQLAYNVTHFPRRYLSSQCKHHIPEEKRSHGYINPDYNSMALTKLLGYPKPSFWKNKKKLDRRLKAITKELMHGASPNQRKPLMGTTLLQVAVSWPLEFFTLLLCYGADPLQFNDSPYETVFDLLRRKKDSEKYKILISTYSRPQKSLSQKTTMLINNVCMAGSPQKITTVFNCMLIQSAVDSDKFIETSLVSIIKRTDELLKECDELWEIFNDCFPKIAVDERRELFQKEFSSDNTFTELIYDREQLIGCNVFEVLSSNEELIFTWRLGMLNRHYNGYGIMDLLAFRPMFALQLLTEKKVICHLAILNEYSYRFVAQRLHYPKYQDTNNNWNRIKNEVIDQMGYTGSYHDDLTTCYVYDGMGVEPVNRKNDLWSDFFYNHIVDGGGKRAALILFPVGNDMLKQVEENLSGKNIRFSEHVQEFSKLLGNFLKENLFLHSIGRSTGFADSSLLFWRNVKEVSIPVHSNEEPSLIKKMAKF